MKKIITSALILALSIGAAQAQTTDKAQKKGYNKENKMRGGGFDKLNLSADQKARMQAIREQHKGEMQSLKNNQSLSAEQSKAQKMELHKKYRAQYESVPTAEQKQQAQQMKAERKASGSFRKGGGKGAANAGRFQQDLNLTQDQQAKMTQLRAESKTKAEAIRNNKSLSEDQKKTQLMDLRKTQQGQMKSILTAEQVQKLESSKKARGGKKAGGARNL